MSMLQRVSSSLFNGHSDGVLGVPLLGEQVAVHYVEAIAVDLKIAADYQVLGENSWLSRSGFLYWLR